jgi:hypothetical protein
MFLLLTQQLFGSGAPFQKVCTRVVGSKKLSFCSWLNQELQHNACHAANECGLLDSVCAPYHHCPVCYHQQSSSSSSSSSCLSSCSSQDFSKRWVLDGGAPGTQQSLLQDHDHLHKTESSKSSKMCGSLLACLVIAAASFIYDNHCCCIHPLAAADSCLLHHFGCFFLA